MNQAAINQLLCTDHVPNDSDRGLLLGNMTTHGILAEILLEVKGVYVLVCG